MLIRVLGSAAGGGFPQWNCGCPNCRGVRDRRAAGATARTQESRGGQRRRRSLVPAQLLAGDPPADRELPRLASARAAPLADRRHPAHQRRSRPLARPAVAARVASADRLRDRAACAAASSRATSSTGRSSASPARSPGGRSRLGREEALGDADGTRDRPHRSRRWRCRASCRCTSRRWRRADPEDNVGLRIRERGHRAAARLPAAASAA